MPALLNFLSNDWMPFAILTKLAWLGQLALMVHVFKTGRPYWWFWVLFSAPLIGGIVYFFVELLPDQRTTGASGLFARLKPRSWRIRAARAALEETPSVKTRLALAHELLEAGEPTAAHAVAVEALSGVFKDDPHTLATVARYAIELTRWDEALALLGKIDTRADRMLALTVTLLKGRALLGAGRHVEAEAELRQAADRSVSEEPRYFIALTLRATARESEAVELLQEIRTRFRKAGPAWRRTEKRWYRLASEALKKPAASPK
jgi:hypothetical protein